MKKEIRFFFPPIIFGILIGIFLGIQMGKKIAINQMTREFPVFFQVGDLKIAVFLKNLGEKYEKTLLETVEIFTKETNKALTHAQVYGDLTLFYQLKERIKPNIKKTKDISESRLSNKD